MLNVCVIVHDGSVFVFVFSITLLRVKKFNESRARHNSRDRQLYIPSEGCGEKHLLIFGEELSRLFKFNESRARHNSRDRQLYIPSEGCGEKHLLILGKS